MFSVLALHPNMAQQILEELRVEPILAELQQKRVVTTGGASSVRALSASDEGDSGTRASMITTNTNFEGGNGEKTVLVTQKKSKTELWNQLKIMSIFLFLFSVAEDRSCEDFDVDLCFFDVGVVVENTVQFIGTTGLCCIYSGTGS